MAGVRYKVEYVAGSGIELLLPLSDGQRLFNAGTVYDLANEDDFVRLCSSYGFEDRTEYPKVRASTPKEEASTDAERPVAPVSKDVK